MKLSRMLLNTGDRLSAKLMKTKVDTLRNGTREIGERTVRGLIRLAERNGTVSRSEANQVFRLEFSPFKDRLSGGAKWEIGSFRNRLNKQGAPATPNG